MQNKKIFLICGKAGHGKSKFAEMLGEEIKSRGLKVQITGFADGLKKCCYGLGWDGNKDEKGRTLLQNFGQLMKEQGGESYWCEVLERNLNPDADVYIVQDCRYKVEADYFKDKFKVKIIKIIREEKGIYDLYSEYKNDQMTLEQNNHSSEIEHLKIDCDYIFTARSTDFLQMKNYAKMLSNFEFKDEKLNRIIKYIEDLKKGENSC